jgi:hypothetical protein
MNQNMGLVSASVTRPADTTAYASGDLVANSTTAGSVVPLSFGDITRGPGLSSRIRRVRLSKTGAGITNASFRLHLFNVLPTVSSGDNAAIVIATGAAGYVGQIDITAGQAFTDGAAGQATTELNIASQAIYGLIEARGAYTPASAEALTVTLEVERY